jgi:hypothetical protein
MDVGKEFRIAHRVIVYTRGEGGEKVFSLLYDDPMHASEAEDYVKKVIRIAELDKEFVVTRNEAFIHKQFDKEYLKDMLERCVL